MVRPNMDAKTTTSSFRWFLAATFMVAVGRNGYNVACSWLLAVSGGGVSFVATFFMAASVVEMLVSPVCGWMCDRFDKRRLAVIADGVRGVCAVILSLSLGFGNSHWYIWLSTAVFATCDRLSLTAMQSMVPHVSETHSLPVANSAAFFFMQVGSLVAAVCTGLILFALQPAFSLLALALCFAGSVLSMTLVTCERTDSAVSNEQSSATLCIDAALLRVCLIYSLLYLGGLLVSAVGPSFVFEEHKGNALDFGRLESAWSVGSILGAVLLIPVARTASLTSVQIAVLVITAGSFSLLKMLDFPLVLLAFCVVGVAYNLGRVAIEVALQCTVPHEALGRAKGLLHFAAMTFGVVVLGLLAVFPQAISPTTIFLAYSTLVMACLLAIAVRLLKSE